MQFDLVWKITLFLYIPNGEYIAFLIRNKQQKTKENEGGDYFCWLLRVKTDFLGTKNQPKKGSYPQRQ